MEKYFDSSFIIDALPALLPYLIVTFKVAGLSVLFGTIVGFVLLVGKLSRHTLFVKVAHGYTTILRCTPSIVLLFLVYYGLPSLASNFGLNLNEVDKIVFVVITFTLQFGAVMSEVMRSAYESIDKGQFEAAVSVGLTNRQAYLRIVVPQAVLVAIPNFGNAFLGLIKEGALAYTIGLLDVMGKASLIIDSNYNAHALEVYIALSLIYWTLSIIIEQFFFRLEKVLSKGKRTLNTA